MTTPLLEIDNLRVSYFVRAGEIPAVVDFSLRMEAGESVGLVGESGCGKSTVAMAIMQYMGNNGGIVGGSIRFKGRDLGDLSKEELRRVRDAASSESEWVMIFILSFCCAGRGARGLSGDHTGGTRPGPHLQGRNEVEDGGRAVCCFARKRLPLAGAGKKPPARHCGPGRPAARSPRKGKAAGRGPLMQQRRERSGP